MWPKYKGLYMIICSPKSTFSPFSKKLSVYFVQKSQCNWEVSYSIYKPKWHTTRIMTSDTWHSSAMWMRWHKMAIFHAFVFLENEVLLRQTLNLYHRYIFSVYMYDRTILYVQSSALCFSEKCKHSQNIAKFD